MGNYMAINVLIWKDKKNKKDKFLWYLWYLCEFFWTRISRIFTDLFSGRFAQNLKKIYLENIKKKSWMILF